MRRGIFKKIFKIFLVVFSSAFTLALILLAYFNFPVKNVDEKAQIGVTFSSRYATEVAASVAAPERTVPADAGRC